MSASFESDEVYDALTTMVLAIHDDAGLSDWFERLGALSSVGRRNEVYRMRQRLETGATTSPPEVTIPLSLLADDRVFAAAREAFRSL